MRFTMPGCAGKARRDRHARSLDLIVDREWFGPVLFTTRSQLYPGLKLRLPGFADDLIVLHVDPAHLLCSIDPDARVEDFELPEYIPPVATRHTPRPPKDPSKAPPPTCPLDAEWREDVIPYS